MQLTEAVEQITFTKNIPEGKPLLEKLIKGCPFQNGVLPLVLRQPRDETSIVNRPFANYRLQITETSSF
jgi:hypothetical protein